MDGSVRQRKQHLVLDRRLQRDSAAETDHRVLSIRHFVLVFDQEGFEARIEMPIEVVQTSLANELQSSFHVPGHLRPPRVVPRKLDAVRDGAKRSTDDLENARHPYRFDSSGENGPPGSEPFYIQEPSSARRPHDGTDRKEPALSVSKCFNRPDAPTDVNPGTRHVAKRDLQQL